MHDISLTQSPNAWPCPQTPPAFQYQAPQAFQHVHDIEKLQGGAWGRG